VGTEAGEGLDALSAMGVAGFAQPVRVLVQVPAGRSTVDAASLRGLMTLSDSLKADPRVREVRSLVNVEAQGSLLGYSVLYSDLPAARARYPDFLDAYLSADPSLRIWGPILQAWPRPEGLLFPGLTVVALQNGFTCTIALDGIMKGQPRPTSPESTTGG